MKIHFISDVHLEFGKWPKAIDVNSIAADVSVLAGDIGVGLEGLEWALSFNRPVIYVMGNHEFYGQRPMADLWRKARKKVAGTHVHLLENESIIFDSVRFIGATLWTDFCLFGEEEQESMMRYAQNEMTDYQRIFVSIRRAQAWDEIAARPRHGGDFLTARKSATLHNESRQFLEQALDRDSRGAWRKTVVVSHHAPSALSLEEQSATAALDSAYASNLDQLASKADLWIHGHVHVPVDYQIANCRVISNPRGYTGIDLVAEFLPSFVVEI